MNWWLLKLKSWYIEDSLCSSVYLKKNLLRWNSRKIKHFKVNNSVAFSTFTVLCNYHLCLVPKHFHHFKLKPCTIKQFPPHFSLLPAPGNHLSVFCHLSIVDLSILDISYKWTHSICDFLCLASFTEHKAFEVHPCRSLCHVYVLHFFLVLCVYIPHHVYPFIRWRTFGLFPLWGYCE